MNTEHVDILIIGAGPAGAVAAALLRQQGREVLMVEKHEFPRFAIGESLLPQSMQTLEAAGMLRDVVEAGFQHKNGAAFCWRDHYSDFDFRDKTSEGWATAWQVMRDDFDDILADAAERAGADLRFCHEVVAVDVSGDRPRAMIRTLEGESYAVEAGFILDASGAGRVLPKLLHLDSRVGPAGRVALCAQVEDRMAGAPGDAPARDFDRNKILLALHPEHDDVWYWAIPFSKGRSSIGVVASAARIDRCTGSALERLQRLVAQEPTLARLLTNARWDAPARRFEAGPSRVELLYGRGYALLGAAGEMLDPVFCSGVTIAIESARRAADCLRRQFEGEVIDWHSDYAAPLNAGIDVFRAYVESWHAGAFQKIVFRQRLQPQVRRMISSVLAGYAWDDTNPFARDARRRLRALQQSCSMSAA